MSSNLEVPRLLKADAARELGSKATFNFEDLKKRGDAFLQQVREEARKIVLQAESDATAVRDQIERESRQAGYNAGKAQAAKESEKKAREVAESLVAERLKSLRPAMESAIAQLRAERDALAVHWEKRMVDLALDLAGRIVEVQRRRDQNTLPKLVHELINLVSGEDRITLRLNPEDVSLFEKELKSWLDQVKPSGESRMIADSQIRPGECIVETPHGVIDARLQTQLERLRDELVGDIQ